MHLFSMKAASLGILRMFLRRVDAHQVAARWHGIDHVHPVDVLSVEIVPAPELGRTSIGLTAELAPALGVVLEKVEQPRSW